MKNRTDLTHITDLGPHADLSPPGRAGRMSMRPNCGVSISTTAFGNVVSPLWGSKGALTCGLRSGHTTYNKYNVPSTTHRGIGTLSAGALSHHRVSPPRNLRKRVVPLCLLSPTLKSQVRAPFGCTAEAHRALEPVVGTLDADGTGATTTPPCRTSESRLARGLEVGTTVSYTHLTLPTNREV